LQAEQRGQATAIAQCLQLFFSLRVPVFALVISEGGSGGALALSVADAIIMLENAIYSVLSPEGFASILWKDESKAPLAAEIIKLTARGFVWQLIIADTVIEEVLRRRQRMDVQKVAQRSARIAIQSYLDVVLSDARWTSCLSTAIRKFRKIGTLSRKGGSLMRRVVITGMGPSLSRYSLGHDVDQVFEQILAKKCAIEPITAFDTSQFKVKLAAEVKDLNMEDYFNARELKFNDRFTQFARIASKIAVIHSKLDNNIIDKSRFGVIMSTGCRHRSHRSSGIGRMFLCGYRLCCRDKFDW
jgi:hypothetical protein